MDHLKLFNNHSDYEAFVSGGTMVKPNVSHCIQENEVHYNPTLNWTVRTKYYIEDISTQTIIGGYPMYCGFLMDGLENVEKLIVDGVEIEKPQPTESIGYGYQFNSVGLHSVDYIMKNTQTQIDYYEDETTGEWIEVEVEVPLTNGFVIGSYMFDGCEDIVELNIPNGAIEFYATRHGSKLSAITVDSSNSVFDSRNNCNAVIETATNKLVCGCNRTVIPNDVTIIGSNAFSNCVAFVDFVVPSSIVEIKSGAFEQCYNIESVTIPASVTTIGDQVFSRCTNLSIIRCLSTTAPAITSRTFYDIANNGTLYVPTGSTGYSTWMGNGSYYLGRAGWTMVEE